MPAQIFSYRKYIYVQSPNNNIYYNIILLFGLCTYMYFLYVAEYLHILLCMHGARERHIIGKMFSAALSHKQ